MPARVLGLSYPPFSLPVPSTSLLGIDATCGMRTSKSWGECPTSRESPYRVSCSFEVLAKQTKNASVQGSLKCREVSNSFWEGTRREKTCLKKVSYLLTYLSLLTYLVSQNKCVFLHVVVLCFLQVFRSSRYAYIGKKGRRFQLCHQFVAVFLLGQDMVMSK